MDASSPSPQRQGTPGGRVTSLKERFVGFALCHLAYGAALTCLFILIALFLVFRRGTLAPSYADTAASAGPLPLLLLLLPLVGFLIMGIYFLLGILVARIGKWTVPTRREACLTLVCSCAGMAALMLFFVTYGLQVDNAANALLVFMMPSCCFALSFPALFSSMYTLYLIALLAAVLPPLLFFLGSFWRAKRQNFSAKA